MTILLRFDNRPDSPHVDRPRCADCGAPLDLSGHPFTPCKPGVRSYGCGLCGRISHFYSAAWL